ncbi:hypothetical protein JW823_06035, partial [bacterium]|nr:hypothetical protein [candidate division CSSED10-310 bacterium]
MSKRCTAVRLLMILPILVALDLLNAEYTFHSVDTFPGWNHRILFGDTDYDGFMELFVYRETGDHVGHIEVFERNMDDRYNLTKIIDSSSIPIVIGDGDADGLSDLCVKMISLEAVDAYFLESDSESSLPDTNVSPIDAFLADSNNPMYISRHGVYVDADHDGRQEAIIPFHRYNSNAMIGHTGPAVLEYTADNTLMLKNLLLPLGQRGNEIYDFAIGDTDQDGSMEVAFCT